MIDPISLWLIVQMPMDQRYRIDEQNSGNAQKYCQSMTDQRNFGPYKLAGGVVYEFNGEKTYHNALDYWAIDPSLCSYKKVALLDQEYSTYDSDAKQTTKHLWRLEDDNEGDWRFKALGSSDNVLLCLYRSGSVDSFRSVYRSCEQRLVKCQGTNYGSALQNPGIFSNRVQINDARCRLRPVSAAD